MYTVDNETSDRYLRIARRRFNVYLLTAQMGVPSGQVGEKGVVLRLADGGQLRTADDERKMVIASHDFFDNSFVFSNSFLPRGVGFFPAPFGFACKRVRGVVYYPHSPLYRTERSGENAEKTEPKD